MREIQNKLGERAQWFRMGVVSATVLTPLVSRWQTVRAAERARELWEASRVSAARPWTSRKAEAELPPLAQRSNISTALWLAGAGTGLAIAGTVAFILVRRRLAAVDEAPLELSLASGNGQYHHATERTRTALERSLRESRTAAPPAGSGGEQPITSARLDQAPVAEQSPAETTPPLETVGAPPLEQTETSGASSGVSDAELARYIGNIRTMVYHDAHDENLPDEANRVYFASQEEAKMAGYRPDRSEAPQSGATS